MSFADNYAVSQTEARDRSASSPRWQWRRPLRPPGHAGQGALSLPGDAGMTARRFRIN